MKNPYNQLPLENKIVIMIIVLGLIIALLWQYFGGG